MKTKYLEVRDSMTLIPVLAVAVSGSDDPLARRAGYDPALTTIILIDLLTGNATNDPFKWERYSGARTLPEAHRLIAKEWRKLTNGSVVDVEFLLGERPTEKESEVVRLPPPAL